MSVADEINKLSALRDAGEITPAEFEAAKKRLLAGQPATQSLRRSRHDRWLGGVCGGLSVYTGMESWIWRLLFALAFFFVGIGLLPYILLWIFVPLED